MSGTTTEQIRGWLLKLNDGEPKAKEALLTHTQKRLVLIARRMLHSGFARLQSLEQTDDVVQDTFVRLLKGWDRFAVDTEGKAVQVADYFSRAAQLMREVLTDLARRHYGRRGGRPAAVSRDAAATDTSAGAAFDPGSDTLSPGAVDLFTDFHRAVEALPENLRQVVDLHWYQDLSHQETAALLGIGESTVRKYWVAARLSLQDKFKDNPFAWKPLGGYAIP